MLYFLEDVDSECFRNLVKCVCGNNQSHGIIFSDSCADPPESSAAEKQGPLVIQDAQMPNMYLLEVWRR